MDDQNTTSESSREKPLAPANPRGHRRSRRILFRGAAVLLGLLPFVLLEVGLRGLDVGRPGDSSDPLSGFNRRSHLFERQGNVYCTARSREPFFLPQEFPVKKPPDGFRIFCFGGSTVYGHPYQTDTAFPKWLELELNSCDPAHSYQAINCGGISYASYRLDPLVKEVLHYQPDLIILATGHNEFLEDRTYHSIKSRPRFWAWLQDAAYSLRSVNLVRRWFGSRDMPAGHDTVIDRNSGLSQEVRARLDTASGYASYHRNPAWREEVIAQFEDSVRDIIASCRSAHVPIILVKLGSNLRDCPPFKSEHRSGLAPKDEREWQKAFDAATAADKTDPKHALQLYQKAEAIDDEYALLDYRIARVLDRLGRLPEALTYYCRARDEDICPLRIIKPMQEFLSRVAVETGTPLLDAARLLSAESMDYIPGFDCYLDHVHPNIGGHQKIAQALAKQMQESGLVSPTANWSEENRRQTYARHLKQLGHRYFAEGKERVAWVENWARRERLFKETLPQDARGYVRLGFRQFDLGDEAAAWKSFGEALKRHPSTAELLREHTHVLVAEGRSEAAARLLRHISTLAENLPGQINAGN